LDIFYPPVRPKLTGGKHNVIIEHIEDNALFRETEKEEKDL